MRYLTGRQRDVLLGLLRGESTAKLAESLFISVYTLREHIQNLYGKFNVENRHELTSLFLKDVISELAAFAEEDLTADPPPGDSDLEL